MSESSLHHFLLVKLFLFLFYHVYREPKSLLMIHSVVSQNAHRETRHAKTLRLLVDSSSYMMDLREVRSLCRQREREGIKKVKVWHWDQQIGPALFHDHVFLFWLRPIKVVYRLFIPTDWDCSCCAWMPSFMYLHEVISMDNYSSQETVETCK